MYVNTSHVTDEIIPEFVVRINVKFYQGEK